MWIALFVALLADGTADHALAPYPTKAACEAANAKVEKMITDHRVDSLEKYGLTCVEVKIKVAPKPRPKDSL